MVWVGNEVWENEVMAVYMNDHDEMDMLSNDGMTLVMENESYELKALIPIQVTTNSNGEDTCIQSQK